jgi:uncharacterized phage-associated protein
VNPTPDFDELSEYEMQVLTEVDEQLGRLNQWELADLTHTLPEWRDPEGSSIPIDPADILKAEGLSSEQIRDVVLSAEELFILRNIGALKSAV